MDKTGKVKASEKREK